MPPKTSSALSSTTPFFSPLGILNSPPNLSKLRGSLQTVQDVQIVQAPSFILPRDAGEERGGGLNGAQRLNGLNFLNRVHLYSLSINPLDSNSFRKLMSVKSDGFACAALGFVRL